jgi:hypothetical protein
MQDENALVPAFLICGGTIDDRDAAIARLAEPVATGHPVAVLRAGTGIFASPSPPLGRHVVVKRTPIGCVCCTAGLVFRVALFGLLHASRPARLVIDLGSGAHISTLERELQGESLARVVRLVARVDLDAMHTPHAVKWPGGPA